MAQGNITPCPLFNTSLVCVRRVLLYHSSRKVAIRYPAENTLILRTAFMNRTAAVTHLAWREGTWYGRGERENLVWLMAEGRERGSW